MNNKTKFHPSQLQPEQYARLVSEGLVSFSEATGNIGRGMALGFQLLDLAEGQATRSQEVFGTDEECGPLVPLSHMKASISAAEDHPDDVLEFADIGLLWLDAARRAGHNVPALLHAMEQRWPVCPLKDE